ncbi:hypothetical protein VNO80_22620 [Phaseolus coccineus]|uniref:Uncharacterized protein n=1 Tax=Phaseolus coccineus TaxID=3886 RepID=A0AAN9M624_PHACN
MARRSSGGRSAPVHNGGESMLGGIGSTIAQGVAFGTGSVVATGLGCNNGYHGVFRFGGIAMHLGIKLREILMKGADPILVVVAREDATEGEDDDQEKGSAQGEAKGGSRCIDGWQRKIWTLHDPVKKGECSLELEPGSSLVPQSEETLSEAWSVEQKPQWWEEMPSVTMRRSDNLDK